MATNHCKLLHEQDSNQHSTCSDCGPRCPYNCTYPELYWPPQPPPIPSHTTTHVSPYVIIILTLLSTAFLFFTYYLIMVTCPKRFRRTPAAQLPGQEEDFSDEDRGFEVDHPIWYINTIGLQSSVINSISVFKYKKDENLIECADCSVCLSEFQENERLKLLPKCNHAFHIPCIDMWLSSHTNCPLCRAGILSNTLTAVLSSDDNNFSPNDQMENLDNEGQLGGNHVQEIEICEENEDSKAEYESVTGAIRSISMDSVEITAVILGEFGSVSGDSTVNIMISERSEI